MSKTKFTEMETKDDSQNLEAVILETRKVKALEKIANSLDALTIWFEEIDKKEWGERIQWYLYEFHNMAKGNMQDVQFDGNNVEPEPEVVTPPRKVRPKKDIETT
jgi:hypothetical protein